MFNKYPLHKGEIEINVPVGVTGNLLVTPIGGSTEIVPVKNGVISVNESLAAHFLAGNNGQPLPGYSKSVIDADKGKALGTGSQPTGIPTIEEVKLYLDQRGFKYHSSTGEAKLQGYYAAEKVKELAESKGGQGEKADSDKPLVALNLETLATINTDGIALTVSALTDVALVKELIAAEANGTARQELLDALEARLTELSI